MPQSFVEINLIAEESRRLSVGIIGAGDIVSTVHLPVLLAMDNVDVAWVADANTGRAKSVARAYGIRQCELPENLDALPYTDVLLLAIPYGAREPYYRALQNRSTAVYVEKPFSLNAEHHRRLCSWFPDYGLACGFQKRSWGPTLLVQRLISQEIFGPLRLVRCGLGGRGIVVGEKYHADIQLAGGGILFEMGVHGVDTILFCTRATGARVDSVKMIVQDGFDLHTAAELVLATGQGNQVGCQLKFSYLQDTTNGWDFIFEHGVLSLLFSGDSVRIKAMVGDETYKLFPAEGELYPLSTYETFYEHWSRFLTGVRTHQANWTSASQSILTTEIVERLYEAGKVAGAEGM